MEMKFQASSIFFMPGIGNVGNGTISNLATVWGQFSGNSQAEDADRDL
jgi:hypothetical protein